METVVELIGRQIPMGEVLLATALHLEREEGAFLPPRREGEEYCFWQGLLMTASLWPCPTTLYELDSFVASHFDRATRRCRRRGAIESLVLRDDVRERAKSIMLAYSQHIRALIGRVRIDMDMSPLIITQGLDSAQKGS